MSARSASRWVVVKFGGTSVSTLANWRNIALVVKRRLESGARVLVVHSAITKITDMLEKLLAAANAGNPDEGAQGHRRPAPPANYRARRGRERAAAGLFRRAAADGQWHRAGARAVGPDARARHGQRRAHGHRDRLAIPQVAGHRRHLDGRARHAVGRGSRRIRQGVGAVGHLFVRARRRARAAARCLDAGGHHAGLHRARQRGQYLPAGTRRFRHLGGLSRREDPRARPIEIWTDVPGMFSANPRATPTRAPDPRAALRRSAGNRDQRRQGAASALPAARAPVPDTFICVRHADAGPRRHADHGRVRRATGAGEGGVQSQGHHADLARQPGHVAPGRLHGRRVRGVQGTRHVGGPGVDLGNQRHRVARSGGQHARRRVVGQAAARPVEALRRAGHRTLRLGLAGRPQHPRHPAQARRRLRVVRGAEGVPGQPGRQRPQLHVRGGREPGRPAGRAVARPADPSAAGRHRSWARPGNSCSRSPRPSPRARSPGGRAKREALLGALGEARLRLCLRPRAGRRRRAGASAASSPSAARCLRSRPIRIRKSCARVAAAGLGFDCVSLAEIEHVLEARARHLAGPHPVHAELRAARRNTSARSRSACT